MGGPNPDYARPPASPLAGMTFGEILAAGWTLRTKCARCGVVLRVHVPTIVHVLGAEAIPWGRRPACQVVSDNRFACDGRLIYMAQTIRHGSWKSMASPPSERELELWRARRASRGPDLVA